MVSPATARTHVSRAMIKLAARDRAQLVVFAYQSGLVDAPSRWRPARRAAGRGGRVEGGATLAVAGWAARSRLAAQTTTNGKLRRV